MLEIIHKLVAIPWFYDLSQWLAGASPNRKVFREEFASLPEKGVRFGCWGRDWFESAVIADGLEICLFRPRSAEVGGVPCQVSRC